MKLGARILKTGIAIVLALFVATLLNLPSPVFAGVAAVFAIQPTIYRSYVQLVQNVQANLIGAATAILFVLLFGNDIIIIGLAAIIALIIMVSLKLEQSIGLALVTLMVIMEVQDENFILFALFRFLTIIIGVLSASLVNLVFLPPRYETKLFNQINNTTEDTLKWIRLSLRQETDYQVLKKDISKIRERLTKLDNLYLMYKEDRGTLKKNVTSKKRRLVVYRKMILATRRSYDILRRTNQFDNDFSLLTPELQRTLVDYLDSLMSYHEHLLLRYIGKVKTAVEMEEAVKLWVDQKEFMSLFTAEIRAKKLDEEEFSFRLLYLLASILEYGESLEHLDQLITSFSKFHTTDQLPELEEN
ncbi:FUSC family protein [Bacillus thermotolerans]|uniref:Lipoprotein n=1 Tax=Bacillus thermotolerans TaxID=1221996 RepID=A0A0F5I472_BACTR|nr:aromatic acid exporter family protein [Bacillus thermotolerans]KKB33756.1 putative lipoprotein [Bacillus thermotolerans]KKB35776.1 putative lipoprotein [Bacillus thermotolerans]KKB40321.1 putative lipoprotein [Bacillus thermotolerans]